MKLLVIILNYRVTHLTIDCLKSIEPETARFPGLKVAVCENGTGGDAEQTLRAAIRDHGWQKWVELTAIHPNRGFTGGNNLIIRNGMASQEPPEYFLLLNADTVVHPGAFNALVRFMDSHPNVGIAGSRLESPDGTPQGSPFRFQSIATELDRGLRLGIVSKLLSPWVSDLPPPAEAREVDWVAGASMIIRRQVIDAIGALDEGLYTYFDDIDYCLNAKRAGWSTWFVPESRIMHLEGMSTGIKGISTGMAQKTAKRRPDYWFQARRRFFLKNYGALYTAAADAAYLSGFALWRLRRWFQRKPDTDPPHMLSDFFRNSVFMTGFQVREVENPALRTKQSGTS
jgi:N-acetylglucosaminyl-diphospho-decaprenol L-rhamnosyltransferase